MRLDSRFIDMNRLRERLRGFPWRELLRAFPANIRRFLDGEERRHSLVHRLLAVLFVTALFVYLTVNAGLWWTASRVIEENVLQQASKWIRELDELGTPLYVSRGGRRLVNIEQRLKNFPEIAFVRYYDARARHVLAAYVRDAETSVPMPTADQINSLNQLSDADEGHLVDRSLNGGATLRLLVPVRVRSIRNDGLLGFSLQRTTVQDSRTVGYIDLGINLGYYREELLHGIARGSLVIAAIFVLALVVGYRVIQRALRPLTALQAPLQRLARGETGSMVEVTGDREIRTIVNALNTTIKAIRERDEALRHLAEHDSLTGLMNRTAFMAQLEEEWTRLAAIRGKSALLFVDLDQFKYVNDTLGHAVGDRLLVQISELLRAHVPENGLVSRFGGDEFLILVRDVTRASAIEVAQTLNALVREVNLIEFDRAVTVNCSIGVALFGDSEHTIEDILSHADMACYAAKTRGRNRYHVYEPGDEEHQRMISDVEWSRLITAALREDGFSLVYQPIFDLHGGSAEYYEVLIRLPLAQGGVLMPDSFLPVAQRFGLLAEIDRWVVRHAFRQLASLHAEGRDAVFSINLSGQSFEDAGFLEVFQQEVTRNDLSPSSIIFEITEQAAVRYMDRAHDMIQSLLALGVRFALDDFGKGFSSFSYLKNLPVHFIKIDGSFISNLAEDEVDQAMVRSIAQIARALGKLTIAEHVQDEASIALLRECGVDFLQGNLLGPAGNSFPQLPRAVSWR